MRTLSTQERTYSRTVTICLRSPGEDPRSNEGAAREPHPLDLESHRAPYGFPDPRAAWVISLLRPDHIRTRVEPREPSASVSRARCAWVGRSIGWRLKTSREEEEGSESGSGALRKTLVELKARLDFPREVEGRLRAAGATFQLTLRQRDVYFNGVRGRLKLRLQQPGRDQLVWYDRPNKADTKESRIVLTALPPDHGLEAVLSPALGVAVVVTKIRRVFDWRGTRVHLDEVDGLGSFLEFEKLVSSSNATPSAHAELKAMLEQLAVPVQSLESGSYSDLLHAQDLTT